MATGKRVSKKVLLIDHPRWAERLSEEYDYEANEEAGLVLGEISAKNNTMVHWICRTCGGKWPAFVRNRVVHGSNCPYCSGRRAVPGLTDLESQAPDIASEWVEEDNGIPASEVPVGSNKKGVWQCHVCGGKWTAQVYSRTKRHANCPYCSGQKVLAGYNDLATVRPDLASQWHPTMNGDRTPEMFTVGSGFKAWWHCPVCGGDWSVKISNRARTGCPYCANKKTLQGFNDLKTTHPSLFAEIHPTKNEGIDPNDLRAGNKRKIWWLCPKCGWSWEAVVASRANSGCGCPYCSSEKPRKGENDLRTVNETLASQWHPTKNGNLKPEDVLPFSHKFAWWVCPDCGHEWNATIASRSNGAGCPNCSKSRGERGIAEWALREGFLVVEQWSHPECRDAQPLRFDLVLFLRVSSECIVEICLVEYDGEQHEIVDTFFNKKNDERGRGLDYVARHDAMKDSYCEETHRLLIRIPYTVKGVDAIGDYIMSALKEAGMGWVFDVLEAQRSQDYAA